MFINIFLRAIKDIWPMLFIFTIILVSIRIVYLLTNKQKIVLYKEIITYLFIIYLLLLYYIVTFQDNNYGTNNLIPFKEIFRYPLTSRLFIRNVVGNILLFVPFGIFVAHYTKNKKIYVTLFLSLLVSSAIEFAQSCIGRTADIDDIILNTLGGVLGCILYKLAKATINKMPKFLKSELFWDIITLLIIIILIYVLFKFNFWRFLVWITLSFLIIMVKI